MPFPATRFVERASKALHAQIDNNIATQLTDVETDQGLTAGTLPVPKEVIRGNAIADNRSPLIWVTVDSWTELTQRLSLLQVFCTIAIAYMGLPREPEENEVFVQRYLTAVRQCIEQDETLDGDAVVALFQSGNALEIIGDESGTRIIYTQGVRVDVQTK